MKSNKEKRVTRVQPYQVALAQESLAEGRGVTAPPPKSKLKPGPLQPATRPTKRPTPPSLSGSHERAIRRSPRLPALQETHETSKLENDTSPDIIQRHESPWDTFEKGYECDLAGTVAVCLRFKGKRSIYAIRQFSVKEADRVLQILRFMNHDNLAFVQEYFCTADSLYTISEFDPLTLDHIVACKQYPKPKQLASLMSQLLDGLAYLIAQGFRHTSLDCSSVLMGLSGELKIARLECCVIRQADKIQTSDLAPVSRIMMELMQKYVKDDGAVGIDDPERWRICPAAIEFLSATTSASSFEELKKVSNRRRQSKSFLILF
ncbi:hypothetical protein N7451_012791 [Penicillium sp. IBT 35674x]|nr:hypothetical protein N7451_012791 [Penicillium sp. IBT 35674x]